MGKHDLDLASRILLHLDRNLVFPLLEFLQERRLYSNDEILKAIFFSPKTNMVDYAMDIHKSLYRTEDVPQGNFSNFPGFGFDLGFGCAEMMDRRVEVIGRLKSLEEAVLLLVSSLQNATLVQELRPKKQYNIQMLNDFYHVRGMPSLNNIMTVALRNG